MDWLATVDVPAMTLSQAVDKEKEGSALADVLNALKDCKVKVLFRDELYSLMQGLESKRLLCALTKMDIEQYQTSTNAQYIKSNPNMINGIGIKDEEDEVKYQLYNLHTENRQTSKVYLISRLQPNTNILQIILNKKTEKHSLIYFQSDKDILSFMAYNRPKLVQHKHANSTYTLAGNPVSPFSTYDPNDESTAKDLLLQAFDEYQGAIMPNNPPDALYTRDIVNRTYVCFRHSGNWEYHGYDILVSDPKLPDYIKRKYNIWK